MWGGNYILSPDTQGKAIANSDDQELKDAFEGIEKITFTNEEGVSDAGADPRQELLSFFKGALDLGGNNNSSRFLVGHELQHFTKRNQSVTKGFGRELDADNAAASFLQNVGMLPSPYQSTSIYTFGKFYRNNN